MTGPGEPTPGSQHIAEGLATEIDEHVKLMERGTVDVSAVDGVVIVSRMELNNVYKSLRLNCYGENEFYLATPGEAAHRPLTRSQAIALAIGFASGTGIEAGDPASRE